MKLKQLLATALVLFSTGAWADDVFKDVTGTYLTNADFEGEYTVYSNPSNDRAIYQPTGWTVSYTSGDPNDMTALNSSCLQWSNFSGKAQLSNGGNNTYWVRMRWGTGAVLELSQTVTLPQGSYKLTAAYYKNGSGGDGYILVNSTTKNTSVNEDVWKELSIDFTSDGVAATKIGCKAQHTNTYEKFLAFDNFVLEWNLTEALTSLIASATEAYNEDTSNSALKAAIDAADAVKDSQDADELETAYNNLKSIAALAVNRNAWKAAKDAAEEAYASTDYANITGAEKVAIKAEIDKAEPSDADGYEAAKNALISATSAFTTAKDSYDAYATAKAAATDVNEADVLAVVIAGNTAATAADAQAASIILPKAQVNKDANYAAPVVTDFVVNGTFDNSDISMWSCNNSFQNKGRKTSDDGNAGNMNNDKPWWENWNGSALVNKMYQTIQNIPNGTYRLDITAFVNNLNVESQYVFANNAQTTLTDAATTGATYEVYTVVTNNTIEVGLEQTTATANWMGIDNVSLRYYGPGDVINDAQNAGHKLAWQEALAAATNASENSEYSNVNGSERAALEAEIAKPEPGTADGYDEAAAALTAATSTFIAAKSGYDIFEEYNVELDYADPAKVPEITEESTAASVITALRAYYESHAMAEGVEGTVNKTSLLTNYTNPSNTNGWTVNNTNGNCNLRIMSNESYTKADGTNNEGYFDTNSWGSAFTSTVTQEIELEAGKYLLTAKARGNGTTSYKVVAGEDNTDVTAIGNTGGVFGRGWNDYSVEFELNEKTTIDLGMSFATGNSSNWLSFGDFRLVRLELYTEMATAEDYAALDAAIEAAEAKTLGFQNGEYAPYNNVAVLEAIEAANDINPDAENAKDEIEALTELLTNGWTANDGDVDAIYNGTFAETGTGSNPKGWSRSNNGWGQQITGLTAEANGVAAGTTTAWYYNTNAAWQYGNEGVYTMPLAANQVYLLTFKYSKHGSDWQSWMKASVLNSSNDGLEVAQFSGADNETNYVTAKAYFTTGAAGNYILSIEQNGNAHLTDVSLVKVASAELALNEGSAYEAANRIYYETVTMTRKVVATDGVGYNTVCLPFDLTAEQVEDVFGTGAEVFTFKDEATGTNSQINFNKGDGSITANTPVLVKATEASTSQTINGVVLKSGEAKVEGPNFDFVGNYAPMTIAAKDYFISGGKLYKSEGNTNLKGFRAYIFNKDKGDTEVKMFIEGEGIVTAIEGIDDNVNVNGNIFNLAGQRVNKAQKGIYIVNGKKYIVK